MKTDTEKYLGKEFKFKDEPEEYVVKRESETSVILHGIYGDETIPMSIGVFEARLTNGFIVQLKDTDAKSHVGIRFTCNKNGNRILYKVIKEEGYVLTIESGGCTSKYRTDAFESYINSGEWTIVTNEEAAIIEDTKPSKTEDVDTIAIAFGNFIRDNYYGVGSPKLQSYHPEKFPSGTVEEIYQIFKSQNK